MIRVHHKAGDARPNLKSALYVWRKLLFKRKATITIIIDAGIEGADTGTKMWLKCCGWKSGIITQSNNERLIAFRIVGEVVELCRFERRARKLRFEDVRAMAYSRIVEVTYTIEKPRGSAMRWPAIPWAEGGGFTAKEAFSYGLEIK